MDPADVADMQSHMQKRLLEAKFTFSVLSVLLSTPDARDQVLVRVWLYVCVKCCWVCG